MDTITAAFVAAPRAQFLPTTMQTCQDIDAPLPIGYGQTNSQPSTVRLMLQWLDPQPGDTVLDVGSGSGWTTALLAYLVGPEGKVYAIEKVPQLVQFGKENCHHTGVKNARFFVAGPQLGLKQYAPYDRILVSAAATRLPAALVAQLKNGGTMVIPIGHYVQVIHKTSVEDYESHIYQGFMFVPLI